MRVEDLVRAVELERESKVGHNTVVVPHAVRPGRGAIQNVLRLEIAVNDVVRVEIRDGVLHRISSAS